MKKIVNPKTGKGSVLATALFTGVLTALIFISYNVGKVTGKAIAGESLAKVQAAIDATPAVPTVTAAEKETLSKPTDGGFKFLLGDYVKASEDGNIFNGCVGKIVDGKLATGGPMYTIELSRCPHEKHPQPIVKSGEEYLELTVPIRGVKEVKNAQ